MIITLCMTMSADGRTEGGSDWKSAEDQQLFRDEKRNIGTVIMGRKTYENIPRPITDTDSVRRIVITHSPESFRAANTVESIEFTDENPTALCARLEREGVSVALLVGGSYTAARFFQEGLVSRVLLTIEPVLLGEGLPLLSLPVSSTSLSLQSVTKLNTKGTLRLLYTVSYDRHTH